MAANLIAGGVDGVNYGLNSVVTNEQITSVGVLGSFASGFIGQAWSSGAQTSLKKPIYEDFGTGVNRMTHNGASDQAAAFWSNTLVPAFQAWGESIVGWANDNVVHAR